MRVPLDTIGNYDKPHDHEPEFRYEDCSKKKSEKLKEQGVKTA